MNDSLSEDNACLTLVLMKIIDAPAKKKLLNISHYAILSRNIFVNYSFLSINTIIFDSHAPQFLSDYLSVVCR